MSSAPLTEIRVLNLASVGPGARAGRWLADYGAEVIDVAPPAAQDRVQLVPPFHAYSARRSLRRVEIDLKVADGRAAFLQLATGADVIIESFRPGVVDRLGIGYDVVRRRNPGIVYCSTTGYGQNGPRSAWAGHDLNYLAVSGFLHCSTPGVDGAPPIPGATVADSAAGGLQAVVAILAALVARQRSGDGAWLDVSVADGALALMALSVDDFLATGAEQGSRQGLLTGRYACYDLYRAGDGRWLTVAAVEPKFWANLCSLLGVDQWTDRQFDDAAQAEIRSELRRVFAGRDRDEWVEVLGPADTCVAPVASVAEVVDDRQYLARQAFVDVDHPSHGRFRQVAPILAGMPRPDGVVEAGDSTRTDTGELLVAAGYAATEVDELRERGVIG